MDETGDVPASKGRPKLDRQAAPVFPERVLRPTRDEKGAGLLIRGLRPNNPKSELTSSPKTRDRKLGPWEIVGRPRTADRGAG